MDIKEQETGSLWFLCSFPVTKSFWEIVRSKNFVFGLLLRFFFWLFLKFYLIVFLILYF